MNLLHANCIYKMGGVKLLTKKCRCLLYCWNVIRGVDEHHLIWFQYILKTSLFAEINQRDGWTPFNLISVHSEDITCGIKLQVFFSLQWKWVTLVGMTYIGLNGGYTQISFLYTRMVWSNWEEGVLLLLKGHQGELHGK